MRGRYQRRLSPSEWITQFAAYIFMILVLVMCVLCTAGYGYLAI